MNSLALHIPDTERVVTVEDTAELRLTHRNLLRMEARPANHEDTGAYTIRDLVITALRQRPDRVIVGEVRGGEAIDMLTAMNTGHDGSMTTLHANSAAEVITRLETMVWMAGVEYPLVAVRRQIADALDLVVHQQRLEDGGRQIVSISEVAGMRGDQVQLQDVFRTSNACSQMGYTGVRPINLSRLRRSGAHLPECLGELA